MGVNSGSKLRYHLVGLSLSDICSLARKRAEGAGRPGFPAVAFDVSWLCYTCRRSTVADTIEHVMAMFLKFLEENFLLYLVFDPEARHHSKKASIAREFERRRNVADCILAKAKILSISRRLREETLVDLEEKKILSERRKDLEKKVKSCEKSIADMDCHPQIVEGLRRKLEELANSHREKIFVLEGMFQADTYIQRLLVQKTVDFAVGNDMDFSVVAGEACLQITQFCLTVKKTKKCLTRKLEPLVTTLVRCNCL